SSAEERRASNPGAEVRPLSGALGDTEKRIGKDEPMSTIKTFGLVDERSLKQLERCMAAGDAEYGVLCADHHPGYSQPIGGAVAYAGYVSPSGVGYDIGCIASGSRVTSIEGFALPIE